MSTSEKLNIEIIEPSSSWVDQAKKRQTDAPWLHHSRRVALVVLRELKRQHLSQAELAAKMEVSRQQIGKIVKGQENLTLETIAKLEKALNTDILSISLQETSNVVISNDFPRIEVVTPDGVDPKDFRTNVRASARGVIKEVIIGPVTVAAGMYQDTLVHDVNIPHTGVIINIQEAPVQHDITIMFSPSQDMAGASQQESDQNIGV